MARLEGAPATARQLIDAFGSLAMLLSADRAELERVLPGQPGVIALIAATGETMRLALFEKAAARPILSGQRALLDYLRLTMGTRAREDFRVLFLNGGRRLVRDELMWRGTIDEVAVYPREIARRALEVGAAGLILVHNHPSDEPQPSSQDIMLTGRISNACNAIDVVVHDHLVVTRHGHASFRALGLL